MTCCYRAYLSPSYRTASGANYWTIGALLYCNGYLVLGGIRTRSGVSQRFNVSVDFVEFLSTEFAACLKQPSRDNPRKASYLRTQQRDQGAG